MSSPETDEPTSPDEEILVGVIADGGILFMDDNEEEEED